MMMTMMTITRCSCLVLLGLALGFSELALGVRPSKSFNSALDESNSTTVAGGRKCCQLTAVGNQAQFYGRRMVGRTPSKVSTYTKPEWISLETAYAGNMHALLCWQNKYAVFGRSECVDHQDSEAAKDGDPTDATREEVTPSPGPQWLSGPTRQALVALKTTSVTCPRGGLFGGSPHGSSVFALQDHCTTLAVKVAKALEAAKNPEEQRGGWKPGLATINEGQEEETTDGEEAGGQSEAKVSPAWRDE